jgi:hypothetical protein
MALQGIQRWLETAESIRLSLPMLSRLLTKTGSAAEKSRHATGRDQAANQQKREAWSDQITALDPARFTFVDESGVTRSMTRRYGLGSER